jgi:hypothetical protein
MKTLQNFRGLRRFERHGLILTVAGLIYAFVGISYITASVRRDLGLHGLDGLVRGLGQHVLDGYGIRGRSEYQHQRVSCVEPAEFHVVGYLGVGEPGQGGAGL